MAQDFTIMLPNRPGVLANLTNKLGKAGINGGADVKLEAAVICDRTHHGTRDTRTSSRGGGLEQCSALKNRNSCTHHLIGQR